MHVVVIGAGIMGAASALELAEAGNRVTIIEPGEPGGDHAASYGNGAWLSPASVVPMSLPGMWRKVPGYLLDPLGPLTIRPAALPALLPWLVRFLLAGATEARVMKTAESLRSLLEAAPDHHAALAMRAGVPDLIRKDGLLYAYPSRAAFEADALAWRLRQGTGVIWHELEGEALRNFEPELAPHYQFAAFVPEGGHCLDPGAYVAALVRAAVKAGATLVRASAQGFFVTGGRLRAVLVQGGEIPADRAIIAAGIRAAPLARLAGDRVPLVAERGYHVEVPAAIEARVPLLPADGKMANTQTRKGLRASGQVELAFTDAPADWRRADILLKHLHATYPKLPPAFAPELVRRWMGHRPSTPDGLPVIGPAAATADIVHAFGHGHVGLAAGAMTARLVKALAMDQETPINPAPFSAARFR